MSQFDSLQLSGLSHTIVLGKRSDFAGLPQRVKILDRSELANTLRSFTSPNSADLPRLMQFYRRISLSPQMPEGRDIADLLAAALLASGYCGIKIRKGVEGPSLPVERAGEIKPIGATSFPSASSEDKYGRVLEMVPQYLPGEMKGAFAELVTPEAIGMTVAILVVWAGSHAVGVGFAIDVLLLAIGFAMVGWSIFGAVGDVLEFFEIMENARGDADLNRAARKLASAIAALGVGTFIALLTRGAGRITAARKANVPRKSSGSSAAASDSQIAKYKPKTEDSKPRKTRRAEPAPSAAVADKTSDAAAKGVDYSRPSGYRKGVRDKVWDDAVEPSTGRVRDPATGRFMSKDKPWDMGHKPGHEFKKHKQSAQDRGISRETFLDEHNTPSSYRPELPSSNRSHRGEDKTGSYFGP
ncbi:HNH/ENDO VII family nuclease [Pelagibius sp. Alg239-R121]|uniref:HNH/ENDO VII family nuclease n=1 Tax=Pelagibius sp. Alg239-R121 TaxID=2993448 RepID=UPI0024A77E08|nr:HNH/ENDO VII family nuclease [Pelagibius sp. Alg239-R121]